MLSIELLAQRSEILVSMMQWTLSPPSHAKFPALGAWLQTQGHWIATSPKDLRKHAKVLVTPDSANPNSSRCDGFNLYHV